MAAELFVPPSKALDANANPYAGAKWFFYATGTTTPQSVYTTFAMGTAHANPVVADSTGKFANIFFDPTLVYRGILKDSTEAVTLHDIDPISSSTLAALAASGGAALIGTASGDTVQESLDRIGVKISSKKLAVPGTFTVTAGAAGNLNGNYTYAIVFRTSDGVSSPSARIGPTAIAFKKGELTGIPVSSDADVIARDIYRTTGAPDDVVRLFYVGTIANNTATTFSDNIADGSLGAVIPWAETAGGTIYANAARVFNVLGNAIAIGEDSGSGYASTAVGNYALTACTSGLRNTAFGVYALTGVTTGDQNTSSGVHSGNDLTTGSRNSFFGYGAGFHTISGVDNVAFGNSAMQEASGATSYNTAVGAYALWLSAQTNGKNTAIGNRAGAENVLGANCIFIGNYAGNKSNSSARFILDAFERASEVAEIDQSLLYGIMDAAGAGSAKLKVNARFYSANSSIFNNPDATNAGWYLNEAGAQTFSTGASSANTTAHAFFNGSALVGAINVNGGTTTSYLNLSDARAKDNIAQANEARPIIDTINVRSFDWKTNNTHVSHGLIAQELQEVFPDAVSQGGDESPWMVDPAKLVPLLIKAVQELSARIEALEAAA